MSTVSITAFVIAEPWLSLALLCLCGYLAAWFLSSFVGAIGGAGVLAFPQFLGRRLTARASKGAAIANLPDIPIPICLLDADGGPAASNARFKSLFKGIVPTHSGRMSFDDQNSPSVYEISRATSADGATYCYAVPADALVKAEQQRASVAESFTSTFASLSIGLAVFDADQRLFLFNPALLDHLQLDPVWLAKRPSLTEVLSHLRENRRIPEPEDFLKWRKLLTNLQNGARDSSYDEEWSMPDGQVFHVTGRPHPQGAVAFLFEDITAQVKLRALHREELDLSQTIMDCMPTQIVGYGASGDLRFSNDAFDAQWQPEGGRRLAAPDFGSILEIWKKEFAEPDVWARVSAALATLETRGRWRAEITRKNGEIWELRVAPLPNSGTMVMFFPPNVQRTPTLERA